MIQAGVLAGEVPTVQVVADGRFSVDESSHLQDVTSGRTCAHRGRLFVKTSVNPSPVSASVDDSSG